jgi:transcriptional regulator with XRE-family HTH domain
VQLKELYSTMNVGERIKKLRELKNFTQQHMAQELNLSLSGYGKIERNETDISISKLEKISAILGVDINTILSFDEKHIFNFTNNQTANGIVQNQYTTQTELIEELIEQYKNENSYLKELVKTLTTR